MPTKEEIMSALKEDVLTLKLKPGDMLSETALSERFQLSRTPLRDVLKQLSLESYIDIYPKKGNLVSYINLDSVEQIIYLRSSKTSRKDAYYEVCFLLRSLRSSISCGLSSDADEVMLTY